jgi:hypothetical protein
MSLFAAEEGFPPFTSLELTIGLTVAGIWKDRTRGFVLARAVLTGRSGRSIHATGRDIEL